MNSQEFIREWGGNYRDNPLARFRQSVQNVQGYGELNLEEFASDGGFRPPIASALQALCSECRGLMPTVANLLALSPTFPEATHHLHDGLHRTVNSLLLRIQKMIDASSRESYVSDLKTMRKACQSLRDLLDEIARRGASHPIGDPMQDHLPGIQA